MMSTIEGKIASGIDGVDILGDYFGLYTTTEDQLDGQAWMCGRVTMEMFAAGKNTPLPNAPKPIEPIDFYVSVETKQYMFAVDTKGILRWKDNTITLSNVTEKLHLVVIVAKTTPKNYLEYLQEKNISYIFAGEGEHVFEPVLVTMKQKFGIETVLLEGGGGLNGSMMAEDLVDEISLLVTPLVLNKTDAPSVFEHTTTNIHTKKYALTSVKQMTDDSVWLRYKKKI